MAPTNNLYRATVHLSIKILTSLILLTTITYGGYLYSSGENVSIKQAELAQTALFEGPHLVYNKHQTHIISATAVDNKMKLSIKTGNKPQQIDVFKPGKPQITFSVPLKTKITTPADSYPQPEKLFVISDVEGNFNTVVNLLQQHKVIDQQLNWLFAKGHLVIIGDVFDRGNHVTELLWLLYKLEGEAQKQGGDVHMLLGNHEIMNLQDDLRYVEAKYTVFEDLLQQQTPYAYVDLFRQNTELGRWLRSKNIVEKIGDTLYTHGGMSPAMVTQKLSLTKINDTMRRGIDIKKADRPPLEASLFGREGPIWYRGYFMAIKEVAKASPAEVAAVLKYYGAKRIAVGHTIVDKPQTVQDGLVIAVDVKHPADHLLTIPPRTSYGVFIDAKGTLFVADDKGGLSVMGE